jgi:hypothetical protein
MPSKHNAPTCFVRGLSYTLTCVAGADYAQAF